MSNRYAAELVRFEPCKPLYEGHIPNGWEHTERTGDWESHHTVSDEGRAGIAKLALLWDQHVDALNAWMAVFGLTQCEHRRPLTDLSWEINTYAFDLDDADDPAIFILCGFHDDASGFCVAQAYHAAGVFCAW